MCLPFDLFSKLSYVGFIIDYRRRMESLVEILSMTYRTREGNLEEALPIAYKRRRIEFNRNINYSL